MAGDTSGEAGDTRADDQETRDSTPPPDDVILTEEQREAIRKGKRPVSDAPESSLAAMEAKIAALEVALKLASVRLGPAPAAAFLEPLKPFSGRTQSQTWAEFVAAFLARMRMNHVAETDWVLNALGALAPGPLKWVSGKGVDAQTPWDNLCLLWLMDPGLTVRPGFAPV